MGNMSPSTIYNHFIIKEKLPSLNEYVDACRAGKRKGAQFKKDIEEIIWAYIKTSKTVSPVTNPVEVHFEWHEADRKRDVDNIISAKKYILDAMQVCGIIKNDSRRYVTQCFDKVYDDDKYYVVVTLMEVA